VGCGCVGVLLGAKLGAFDGPDGAVDGEMLGAPLGAAVGQVPLQAHPPGACSVWILTSGVSNMLKMPIVMKVSRACAPNGK